MQAVSHVYDIIYATRPAPQKRRRQENEDDDLESSFSNPIDDFHQFENTVQATPSQAPKHQQQLFMTEETQAFPKHKSSKNAQRSLSFSF